MVNFNHKVKQSIQLDQVLANQQRLKQNLHKQVVVRHNLDLETYHCHILVH